MEEPFPDVKSLQNTLPGLFYLRADISQTEIIEVVIRVDDFHDTILEQVADREPHITVNIHQPVIGEDNAIDEFLNNKGYILRLGVQKVLQLLFVINLVRIAGTGAEIGLNHQREAGALDEALHAFARSPGGELYGVYTAFMEEFFHLGLLLQVGDEIGLGAVNVEIRADGGILLQPVFVQRLEAVNLTVFIGEKATARRISS